MNDMVMDREVEVNGHAYRVGRMSVFDQMHVASELRSVISGLAFLRSKRPKKMADKDFDDAAQFILASPAGVSPEARDRAFNLCLSTMTRRSTAGAWSPILAGDNVMQFADIELPEMCKLLFVSFEHNKLLDFFSTGLSSSGPKEKATGQD